MIRAASGRAFAVTLTVALLCVVPVEAHAAGERGSEGPPFGRGLSRSIEKLPHGAAFLEVVAAMHTDDSCECDFAHPVADVDDDGTEDVLYARYRTGRVYSTELTVLEGRTGEPLFDAPVEVPGWAYATGADLGPHGRGLVYISSDIVGWAEDSVTIGAVTGRGVALWQRRWDRANRWVPPTSSVDVDVHSVEFLEETGAPTDLVVATSTSVYSHEAASTVTLERVSGVTGTTADRGSYAVEGVDEVAVDAVAGVSGPGTTDLLVQTSTVRKDDVTMELRHEVSSAPSWSISLRPPWGFLHVPVVADVTGDDDAEVLVQKARPLRLEALDASTGETTWSVGGFADDVVPGARGADVLIGDTTVRRDGTIVHEVLRTGARSGWSWTRSFAYSGRYFHSPWGFGWSSSVGDATGDGVADVRVDVELLDDDGDHIWIRGSRQHLVDGRTGNVLRAGSRFFPLEGSFTGATTDSVEFLRGDGRLAVSGVDGASGDVLWTTRLPVAPDSKPCTWYVDVLRTRSGSDLLFLELPGGAGDVELVLDGRSGKLLWKR